MLVTSIDQLNQIREECKSMVTKRAAASSFAAIVPIPGTNIVADIGMLMQLLPEINKKFGLSKEEIEQLDENSKIIIAQFMKEAGSLFVGKVITKELVLQALQGMAKKIAIQQIVKYIPILGQAAAAAISFAVMKHVGNSHYVGNSHIEECYAIAQRVLEKQDEALREKVAATSKMDDVYPGTDNYNKQTIIEMLKGLKELFDMGIIDEKEYHEKKKALLSQLYKDVC